MSQTDFAQKPCVRALSMRQGKILMLSAGKRSGITMPSLACAPSHAFPRLRHACMDPRRSLRLTQGGERSIRMSHMMT